MSEPLKELRAQRDLIQKHLDWLDAKIASAEKPSEAEPSNSSKPKSSQDTPKAVAPTKASVEATATKAPSVVAVKPASGVGTSTEQPIHDLDELAPATSSGSDIKRAQIGCFALFILLTLSFLFLLFGLPYLID